MAAKDYLEGAKTKTAGGIQYRLMPGSTVDASDEETTASETYLMRAKDVAAFYFESLPPPIVFLNLGGFLPLRRRMPGAPFLITKKINVKGHTDDLPFDPMRAWHPSNDGSGAFSSSEYDKTFNDLCLVTIEYSTSLRSNDEDVDPFDPTTFLERSMTAGGQVLSIPPHNTKVQARDVNNVIDDNAAYGKVGAEEDNRDQQHSVLKVIPTVEHNLKWKFVPNPNFDTIFSALGKVNDRTSRVLHNAARETCLFVGVSAQQSFVWNGASSTAQPWSIDFRFSQRIVREGGRTYGWNHIYIPHKGRWGKVSRGGRPLHESFNVDRFFV